MTATRAHRETRASTTAPRCSLAAALIVAVILAQAPPALGAAIPAQPIPEGSTTAPTFTGAPAVPRALFAPQPPRHPFMAPNGRSNIHDDAYQTDTYTQSGPLGRGMRRRSTFQVADCATVAFDRRNRIVTVCVGVDGPRLLMLHPQTLATLASFPLPPRDPTSGDVFTGFAGGGYFYLDHRDRVVTPTTNEQIWVIRERETPSGPEFQLERTYDLSTLLAGDQIVSALPDYDGLIWFVSSKGVVGTVHPQTGVVRSRRLVGEEIGNSFAVDETGGV
jgi:hypothetical protein